MRALIRSLVLIAALSISAALAAPAAFKEVDVFSIGEAGYYCIKIPYLLSTARGSLLAFAEARYDSCSDFTATDLVFKRSVDGGATWSPLRVLYSNTSLRHNVSNVIGNAAPIQLRNAQKRILVPFCRNNIAMLQTWSDDDGLSWGSPVPIPGATRPGWQWVAAGPPGGLQLVSGRLVLPSYHSYWPHWTDGTDTRTHMLLNDDPDGGAATWRIGGVAPGFQWTNENQAVELEPNHLLVAARGLLTQRIQIESVDGGETLGFPYYISITEPLDGCEGSIVNHRAAGLLFYSGTVNTDPARYNMTLWQSSDQGASWQLNAGINTGRTAYSSLVVTNTSAVGLLYERSNASDFIFLPTRISYLVVWPQPTPTDPAQLALLPDDP